MATEDRFWNPIAAPGNGLAAYALGILEMLAYRSDEALAKQWADIFGMPVSGRVLTPGRVIPNLIYVGHADRLIIAIPGTTQEIQMVNNILGSGQRKNPAFAPGGMHSFFLWCAESIVNFLGDTINTFPDLHQITFVGHSLGGAVAQILADWTAKNTSYSVKYCCTFNSPRVGDAEFAETVRTYPSHLYYCTHDMVCELPTNVTLAEYLPAIGGPLVSVYEHRDDLIPIPSLNDINASWLAIGISKVVYPVKWGIAALSSSATAASVMRALGFVGSRAALASWLLPLPAWILEHRMDSVLNNLEAVNRFDGVPEREALKALHDYLTATETPVANPNPFPFALAAPANFASGVTPPAGATANLPSVPPGTRTEVIEGAFEWESTAADWSGSSLISVDDAFIQALTSRAAATPGGNPLTSAGPIPSNLPVRLNWMFKAKDRRLLTKLAKVMQLIDGRDEKTAGDKPTAELSNREPIIDEEVDAIFEAWEAIRDRVNVCLGLVKESD